MNYSGCFLIVSDYIKWQTKYSCWTWKELDLSCICSGYNRSGPNKINLILKDSIQQISMPDFDIDFVRKNLRFEYLKDKYNSGVAHIITFGKLKARMVLRDVGRVLGLPYGHVDKICKMIPFDPSRPLTLLESINREPRFKDEIKSNKKVEKLINLSLKLEGLNRNMATHAAGVVIAGEILSETVPLYKDHNSNLFLHPRTWIYSFEKG